MVPSPDFYVCVSCAQTSRPCQRNCVYLTCEYFSFFRIHQKKALVAPAAPILPKRISDKREIKTSPSVASSIHSMRRSCRAALTVLCSGIIDVLRPRNAFYLICRYFSFFNLLISSTRRLLQCLHMRPHSISHPLTASESSPSTLSGPDIPQEGQATVRPPPSVSAR